MYCAYGSLQPGQGTTNLHLDVSDAANVMDYVGMPVDCDKEKIDSGNISLSYFFFIDTDFCSLFLFKLYKNRDVNFISVNQLRRHLEQFGIYTKLMTLMPSVHFLNRCVCGIFKINCQHIVRLIDK